MCFLPAGATEQVPGFKAHPFLKKQPWPMPSYRIQLTLKDPAAEVDHAQIRVWNTPAPLKSLMLDISGNRLRSRPQASQTDIRLVADCQSDFLYG